MRRANAKDPVSRYLEWDARIRACTRHTVPVLEALFATEDRFLSRWRENRLPERLEAWLSAVFQNNLRRSESRRRRLRSLEAAGGAEWIPAKDSGGTFTQVVLRLQGSAVAESILAEFFTSVRAGVADPKIAGRSLALTKTQRRVLAALLASSSIKEAATRISMSPRDLRNHLKEVAKKIRKILPPPPLLLMEGNQTQNSRHRPREV